MRHLLVLLALALFTACAYRYYQSDVLYNSHLATQVHEYAVYRGEALAFLLAGILAVAVWTILVIADALKM
jgi:hypothetical protein